MKKKISLFLFMAFVFLLHRGFGQEHLGLNREASLFDGANRLAGNLNVVMISLQPGFEDPSALAYVRWGQGAEVTSVYITNGELLDDPRGDEYPHLLAARRRYEAAEVCEKLGVESYFMNLPDPGGTGDTTKLWSVWNRDSLKMGLLRVISHTKPDIILLTSDRTYGHASIRLRAFQEFLVSLLERLRRRTPDPYGSLLDAGGWRVDRVFVEADTGMALPVERVYTPTQKTYSQIGLEAHNAYTSIDASLRTPGRRLYQLVFSATPARARSMKEIQQGLPRALGGRLRWLQQEIRSIATTIQRDYRRLGNLQRSRAIVPRIMTAIDSATFHIKESYEQLSYPDRRALVHWKGGLEDLRILLLGVGVSYSFSETVLTNSQLTFLTIDTVYGLPTDGTSELYFPDAGKQWILNEALEQRVHLHLKQPYRLISPRGMKYDLPPQEYGMEKNTIGTPFFFYVIHNNPVRWKSFVLPVKTRLWFAPKFTVEVFNPIVRLQRDERVIVRLTNHSRDGVVDTLYAADSLIVSSRIPFRLSTKESSLLDTLRILEAKPVAEGSYLVSLEIGGESVGQFAARAINVAIDSTGKVGLLTSLDHSILAGSLRRLGIRWQRVQSPAIPSPDILPTLIVDRATLTSDTAQARAISRFAEEGGSVVVLAQSPDAWNRNPLIPGVSLTLAQGYDENSTVDADTTHPFFSKPNVIARTDWDEWLWYRSPAAVQIHSTGIEIPARIQSDGNPVLMTYRAGKGRITYVNLALHLQLLNVHPGVLRLLANLVAR